MAVAVPILAIGIGLVALGVSVWVVRPLVVIAVLVLFIPLTRSATRPQSVSRALTTAAQASCVGSIISK